MTNRRVAAGVLAMLLWAGVNEAGAQGVGWRGWLDRLSGPGEFSGGELSIQVFCGGVPKPDKEQPKDSALPDRKWGGVDVACNGKLDSAMVKGQRKDLWRVAVGFEFGQSSSAYNPLEYEGRGPGDGPVVTLRTLVSAVDFAPNAWLEVGAGGGVGQFSTAGFGTTWKPLVQPLRISVRPVALLVRGRNQRPLGVGILQLKFALTSFPGGFDAADFGAVPGSWQVGTEVLKSFTIVLDFGELLRR